MGRLDFLEDLGLEKQASKQPKSFAGKVGGYFTVVEIEEGQYTENQYSIRIGINAKNHNYNEINSLLERIAQEYKIRIANNETPSVVTFAGNIPLRKKKLQLKIEGIIKELIAGLKELGVPTGDFVNGDVDDTIALYQFGNSYVYLSEESYQDLLVYTEEEVSAQLAKDQYRSIANGIGGAIVGALIGSVIWGVLLYFGFYAWFAGVLGIILALRFYERSNGLMNLQGITLVSVIVIISLLVANIFAYSIIMYEILRDFGFTFPLILLNFVPLLQELEAVSTFMLDLFLGIGVAAIFAVIFVYREYNLTKNANKITKV